MFPIKSSFDRLVPALRRAASGVRGGHVVALSAVAVAAFGLAGLRAVDLPGPRPISDTDRLRIEVVQPVEPAIVSGSVMEVGELVDGFQGVPRPLPPLTDVAWSSDDGWDDEERYPTLRAEARRVAEVRSYHSRPEPERATAVRTVQRWFGFDEPRRDFQAERAARRARMEAMERDARERNARERHAAERFRRERAEDERHASERLRRERAEDDRYAWDRRRDETRYAPQRRDDRPRDRYDDPRSGWDERDPRRPSGYDAPPPPPPPGPRPYDERG